MSEHVYDEAHVVISQMIGRKYNNPLGEGAFPILERLARPGDRPIHVLDVGCGRGWTTLWWARRGARVTAFDPSEEMLKEARQLVEENGLGETVHLACADVAGFGSERNTYDLAIVHDVLCYSEEVPGDLGRILDWCAPGGVVSVTNYFGDALAGSVVNIAKAWGIQPPRAFDEQQRLFEQHARRLLLIGETTRQYRAHWADMRRRMVRDEEQLVEAVGEGAVSRFARQIESIERAIEDRQFGHLWAILEAGG